MTRTPKRARSVLEAARSAADADRAEIVQIKVFRPYFEHVGGAEGIEIDLARSLAADLNDDGG